MKISTFELERYFAKYEFSARYLLSCSDCEPLLMSELLQMADQETLQLWENLKLSYTETRGHPLLREVIAEIFHLCFIDFLHSPLHEGISFFMSKIGSYTKIHTNRREHSVIDGDTLEELMDKIKEQADKLRKKVGLKALTESAPGKEATPLTSFDNDKNIPIMRRVRTVIAK